MAQNEKSKLNVNRLLAFLVGGLLVFGVMSLTVVKSVRTENTELTEALDVSRYEAGRLLSGAEAQFAAGDFVEARASLEALIENQPGSAEAVEGRTLLVAVQTAISEAEARWEQELPGIRDAWSAEMAAKLLADSDDVRAKLESEMEATINAAWERAKADVRSDWEN